MTRLLLLPPLLALLVACDAPPRPIGGGDSALPPMAAGPVTVPMDPGQIRCAQIAANPGYLSAAADWVDGRWRAATLSGALPGPVPDRATLEGSLSAYCESTGGTARTAFDALTAG